MKSFSRFQPPRAEDEIYECPGCGVMFHYTKLDGLGLCRNCREEKLCDEMEEEGKDRRLNDDDDKSEQG